MNARIVARAEGPRRSTGLLAWAMIVGLLSLAGTVELFYEALSPLGWSATGAVVSHSVNLLFFRGMFIWIWAPLALSAVRRQRLEPKWFWVTVGMVSGPLILIPLWHYGREWKSTWRKFVGWISFILIAALFVWGLFADFGRGMFGLGWQELVILLVIAGPIAAAGVLAMRGRLADVAAGLGFLQGLANLAFAIIGWPPEFSPALMILQGVVMLTFAVATYRRKLWGIYGLCAIAVLGVGIALYERAHGVWWIPPLIYLAAAVSMHRAASAKGAISREGSPGSDVLSCPRCGEEYRLSDYRADAPQIFCGPCGAELPKYG